MAGSLIATSTTTTGCLPLSSYPLACTLVVRSVLRLHTRRQSSIRLLSLWAFRRNGYCLGSDVTQTLHKRANRSARHASWHQREIVPVQYVIARCGVYTMHILQYSAVLGTPPPIPAPLGFPSAPRGLSRPRARRSASLNRPQGLACELPATFVPHRPSP